MSASDAYFSQIAAACNNRQLARLPFRNEFDTRGDGVRNRIPGPALRGAHFAPQCRIHRRIGFCAAAGHRRQSRLSSPLTRRSWRDLSMRATLRRWSTLRCSSSPASPNPHSAMDYEAHRDHLHSFSGVITMYVDQLHLTDAGGIAGRRSAETGSLIGNWGCCGRRRAMQSSPARLSFPKITSRFSASRPDAAARSSP